MQRLRPPSDPDNFRVKTGRFGDRFYTDPLPPDPDWAGTSDDEVYPAVSTVKKAVGQDWTRAAMKRQAKRPDELAVIAQIESEFERKERLYLLSEAGLDQASGRGTIVHQHIEAELENRLPLYELSDVVKPYIRTADAFLAAYQPKLVAVEFVAINRTLNIENVNEHCPYYGVGGTGDAVVEIDGQLWMVDWKSRAEDSDHKAYSEEAGQVAAYGKADYWIVADPESPTGSKRIKPLELAGGLIVSIKPDSYECFPIDLDEGMSYFTDLHAWWQARRAERVPVKRKWAPRVAPDGDASQLVEADESPAPAPTVASNKARFDALPEVKKGWVREAFARRKLNPNDPATAGEVSRIIGEKEGTPDLRQMQETAAEQRAEHKPEPEPEPEKIDPTANEGGPASDEMVSEARLMFDMAIGDEGRAWCGHRVVEANDAEVGFQISLVRSAKRAHIYHALCNWARLRLEKLTTDEEEGNIEFASLLFMVDGCEDGSVTLGHRLGLLTAEEAEKFAAEVNEVVQSELGDQPVTDPETTEAQQEAS